MITFGPDDPFSDIIREQAELMRMIKRTETKETPIYDKGITTPAIAGLTIAGTFTYDTAETYLEWTRIGNRCFYNGRVRFTAIGTNPTGFVVITGLPFAVATMPTGSSTDIADFSVWTLNTVAGYTHVGGVGVEGESQIRLTENGDNVAPAAVLGGEVVVLGGAGDFEFKGHYRIS